MTLQKTIMLGLATGFTVAGLTLGAYGAYKWMQAKHGNGSPAKTYALFWGGLAGLVVGVNLGGGLMRIYNEREEERLYPGARARKEAEMERVSALDAAWRENRKNLPQPSNEDSRTDGEQHYK